MRSIAAWIAKDSPSAAAKWRIQVRDLMERLARFPLAYEEISEAKKLGLSYRHKRFGNYRIIYRVADDTVSVVRVVHAARALDFSNFREF